MVCRFRNISFVVMARKVASGAGQMALLQMIGMISALVVLVLALARTVGGALLSPVAMLGATAGIALGLLGAGQLWMTGGFALLAVGPIELANQRPFEALFAAG